MRHEVEAGHQHDEVDKEDPVTFDGDFALTQEGAADAGAGAVASGDAVTIGLRLGEHETEEDDQHGRTGAEPVEWAPAVGCGVDETAGEGCREQVAERVALLQHA